MGAKQSFAPIQLCRSEQVWPGELMLGLFRLCQTPLEDPEAQPGRFACLFQFLAGILVEDFQQPVPYPGLGLVR